MDITKQGGTILYMGRKPNQRRVYCRTNEELNQELTTEVERQLARLAEFKAALAKHFPRTDDQASK